MKTIIRSLIGIIFFVLLWQLLAAFLDKNIIVPTPGVTFSLFFQLLLSPATSLAGLHTALKVLMALG